jgi:hypothetical protein
VGDVGIVAVSLPGGSGAFTVSDSLNGSYALLNGFYGSGVGALTTLYWVKVTTAGTPTITITEPGSYFQSECAGFQGFLGTPTADTAINASFTGSSTTIVASPVVTNYPNEVVLLSQYNFSYIPAGPGNWTTLAASSSAWYAILATAGTTNNFSATLNSSSAWVAVIAAVYDDTVNPNRGYNAIFTGTTPGDNTGDVARVGGTKLNDDMTLLYSVAGARATTPGCFSAASTAGTTTTLTDTTQTWATNQFAGQYVTITTGAPSTTNVGYSALIASNTATVLTFAALPFAVVSGCGYEISPTVTTAQTDGQATSVGGTGPITLIDATKSWTTAQWAGYQVTFLGGIYAGKSLPISSNTATTLSLGSFFTTAIAAGTPYIIGTRTGTNYATVTAGTAYSIGNGAGIVSINGPTSMTLTTPQHPIDGDVVRIVNNYTSTITTFSVVGYTGQTAPTVPSTLTAQQGIAIWYDAASTTWYRLS